MADSRSRVSAGCQHGAMSTTDNAAISTPGLATGSRALVVEDERALADLLASYLERDGFEVTKTFDGVSAVAIAREVDPDLLLRP